MSISAISLVMGEAHASSLAVFVRSGVTYLAWTSALRSESVRRLYWRPISSGLDTTVAAQLVSAIGNVEVAAREDGNLVVVYDDTASLLTGTPRIYAAVFDVATGARLHGPMLLGPGGRPSLTLLPNRKPGRMTLCHRDWLGHPQVRETHDGGASWGAPYPVLNNMAGVTADIACVPFDEEHVALVQVAEDTRPWKELGNLTRTRPLGMVVADPLNPGHFWVTEAAQRQVAAVNQLSDTLRGALAAAASGELWASTRVRQGSADSYGEVVRLDCTGSVPAPVAHVLIAAAGGQPGADVVRMDVGSGVIPPPSPPPEGTPLTYTPASYRFWRVFVEQAALPGASTVSLADLTMREALGGPNVCSGGTAFADSTWSGSYTAAMGFDGNPATAWSSAIGVEGMHYLGYDFGAGQSRSILQITIRARVDTTVDMPSVFRVEGSNGSTAGPWTTVWRVTAPPAPWVLGVEQVFSRPPIDVAAIVPEAAPVSTLAQPDVFGAGNHATVADMALGAEYLYVAGHTDVAGAHGGLAIVKADGSSRALVLAGTPCRAVHLATWQTQYPLVAVATTEAAKHYVHIYREAGLAPTLLSKHLVPSRVQRVALRLESATTGLLYVAMTDRLNVYRIHALDKPVQLVGSFTALSRGSFHQLAFTPNGNVVAALGQAGLAVLTPLGDTLVRNAVTGIGAHPWRPSKGYSVGQLVTPRPGSAYSALRRYFQCTQEGVSGAVDPPWGPVAYYGAGNVVDNTVRWRETDGIDAHVSGVAVDVDNRRFIVTANVGSASATQGRVYILDATTLL